MSIVNRVFTATVPTRDQWQAAIEKHGFDVELDAEFDPQTFSGFLPVRYNKGDAGFEYYLEETVDDEFASRPHCVTLVTHSDMNQLFSAVVAAATLAAECDGVFFDETAGEYLEGEDAVAWARVIIDV